MSERTEEEERLIRWTYYLSIAIVRLERDESNYMKILRKYNLDPVPTLKDLQVWLLEKPYV